MAVPARSVKSYRDVVATFAAHLARLLNTGNPVEVNALRLEQRLERTLAGTENNEKRVPHAILGYNTVAGERSATEVARRWLQEVLGRRLRLARTDHAHKGHELLLALCRRGNDPAWSSATLARAASPVVDAAANVPVELPAVSQRLSRLDGTIAQANPAASTRAQHGPLWLVAGGGHAEVIDELSVWNAIVCGPMRLAPLREGPQFNAFCSLVIKAVETANAPYGALIAVGLSPFDWAEEVGINTAKKLGAFLNAVRAEGGGGRETLNDIAVWSRIWQQRQVPGYASAEELWASELGRATRLRQSAQWVQEVDVETLPDPRDLEADLLDEAPFRRCLDQSRTAGVIDDDEHWLLEAIYAGSTLAELAGHPRLKARFGGSRERFDDHVAQLQDRLIAFARQQGGDDDADDDDPSR